jgi:Xaa-Pro aminopeptidase
MDPDLSALDEFLAEAGTDGYLFNSGGDDSDNRYVSGFDAPDPFVTLYTPGGTHLLVGGLEYGRAKAESRADRVAHTNDYDHDASPGSFESRVEVVAAFLEDSGAASVSVPERFPAALADALRDGGVEVVPETDGVVTDVRAVKTDEEVEWIRDAQTANEAAMATVEDLLGAATVEDGELVLDGEALTSDRVKTELETTLLEERCGLDEAIVAGGADGAEPHNRGSGPLPAGEPIVVDIFPRSKETSYHGDMTRTFVVGEPADRAREFYDLTEAAFEAALEATEAGVPASAVHGAACDVYEEAGYPTLRSDPGTETGFIHSTGHGIGLDVHEGPSVSHRSDEPLEAGHVVTIEPGLYDPAVGGVRIEDAVVVTDDGYRNLTDYPVEFVVG